MPDHTSVRVLLLHGEGQMSYIQRVQMIEMQDDSYLYSKIISLYDGTRGYN